MTEPESKPLVTVLGCRKVIVGSKATVSIGLVTHNGERYISQTLDSLLAQDYDDFEILISDNASTDRTYDTCRSYAAEGKRIKCHRNGTNIGSVANFNHVFSLCSGQYFMWAADHDLYDKQFISKCVAILDANPSVVLCHSQTVFIDSHGNHLGIKPGCFDTRGFSQAKRFRKIASELTWCDAIYGVIRSSALRRTRLFRLSYGADNVLLAELSLLGAFAEIREPLFLRRINRSLETEKQQQQRHRLQLYPEGEAKSWRHLFPYLSFFWEHFLVVFQSRNPWLQKVKLVIVVFICIYTRARRALAKRRKLQTPRRASVSDRIL